MVLPIFKSHYSIGKSILTLKPKSKVDPNGSDSIVDIASDAGLQKVILIEDTMHGFLEAKRNCEEADLQLIFGIRINVRKDEDEEKEEKKKKAPIPSHKVVILAKNDEGVKSLYKIYSKIHCDCDEAKIKESDLKKIWDKDNLVMVIPFYDSYVYHNNFHYNVNFMFDSDAFSPTFFIESNGLPFDEILTKEVMDHASKYNHPVQKVKSIYYRNRSDFRAFQTYKIISNRAFGKELSIQSPNLENCGSEEFCMESWLEL